MRNNNSAQNNIPTIFLDEEGYEKFCEEIKNLSLKYNKVLSSKCEGQSFNCDNDINMDASYMDKEREARLIYSEIQYKTKQLQKVVIIQKHNDEELVDINDVVTLNITGAEEQRDLIVRLVASFPELDAEIQQISINSPLGKAIYQKHIGDKSSYTVKDKTFNITIVDKLNKKLSR